MRACDWLVIPSRIESIPLVFVDALHMGIPVVAAAVGDLDLLVTQYAVGSWQSQKTRLHWLQLCSRPWLPARGVRTCPCTSLRRVQSCAFSNSLRRLPRRHDGASGVTNPQIPPISTVMEYAICVVRQKVTRLLAFFVIFCRANGVAMGKR